MRNARTIEIAVGLFVLAGLAAVLVLAMQVSNIAAFQRTDGYTIIGSFGNIGGLKERAPVTMAGVTVGRVASIGLDPDSYDARVAMTIRGDLDELPSDTSARILTSGLLGEQYVGLEPGGMPDVLGEGDELMLTQSALVLENLISQFIYGQESGED